MDFQLTEEQREYRREFARFAEENMNDEHYKQGFSRDLWLKMARFGMFGMTVEQKYGGLEESYQTAAAVSEALGYACHNNGLLFTINNHIWVAQNMIYLYGSESLKAKYIKKMVDGQLIGCFALTESESGSDAFNMSAKAVADGDGYRLDGTKMFVSNGPIADIFIVIALTETKKMTAFVVEKAFSGVKTGPDIQKMGLESCPTCELVLQSCYVPAENVLGTLNGGNHIASAALEWERCFEAAPHIGVMQRLMERCIEHAKMRRQFQKPLEEFQGVTHKIADMYVAVETARNLLYKIAWLKDRKKNAFLEAAVFKLYLSEQYVRTCKNAMQIFGGYGYTKEYGLEQEMRDALASTVYSGTSEMQRNTIYSLASISDFIT